MKYNIINNLPIDYEFSAKSKKELKLYEYWFIENKEYRIQELSKAVNSTGKFENWCADFSPSSLDNLGIWLEENIKVIKIPDNEYKDIRLKVPHYIKLNDWDLSIESRSLLVDVGIYIGEVFIHTYPMLRWEQNLSKRRGDNNLGHMVIKMQIDFIQYGLCSHSLKTIFQHKVCIDKLYADSFYKVQKNSHSSFEVICCCS